MKLFIKLKWFFYKQWRRYLSAIMLLISIAILQLIPPRIVGMIIDNVVSGKASTKFLLLWLSVIIFTALMIYIFRCMWRILLFGASYRLGVELRNKIYYVLSNQLPEFYLRHRTGDLIARATNDVDRVVFAAGEGVLTLVDSLVMGGSVLLVMSVHISYKLTFLALLPMPIMAILIRVYGKKLYQRFYKAQVEFSMLNNQVQDNLSNIRIIKDFGLEEHQSHRFDNLTNSVSNKNMLVAKIDALFEPTIYFAIGLSNLLSVVGGSILVIQKIITIGQLTSFIMYLGLMVWPMLALAWMFNIVERGSAAYGRICQILKEKNIEITTNNISISSYHGVLKIKIKRFCYPEFHKFILRDINISIYPGQILGICGSTGSGKSTLLSLILRYFNIDEGAIYFNNISIHSLYPYEWLNKLAVVNQYPILFSDSIANNIALGVPESSMEKIINAAKLSCLHDDILSLPDKYNTQIGERGVILSSGQKQRLSIARAVLLNRQIFILDGVLSSVDYNIENQILNNLYKWGCKKTLIITSHRLSTLHKANEIIVLNNGRIMQRGNHMFLINQIGWYRSVYYSQKIVV